MVKEYLPDRPELQKIIRASNWNRRPLPPIQQNYAADDAEILFDVKDAFERKKMNIPPPTTVDDDSGHNIHKSRSRNRNGIDDDEYRAQLAELNHEFLKEGSPFVCREGRQTQFCVSEQEAKLIRKLRGFGIDTLGIDEKLAWSMSARKKMAWTSDSPRSQMAREMEGKLSILSFFRC